VFQSEWERKRENSLRVSIVCLLSETLLVSPDSRLNSQVSLVSISIESLVRLESEPNPNANQSQSHNQNPNPNPNRNGKRGKRAKREWRDTDTLPIRMKDYEK